jgi:hypothetical protein
MNVVKTLFAQVMEFVPWKTFGRIIDRHKGDAGVRTLGCADLFPIMAFAQLTWRESLRDVEACLAANQAKLFHMGLKASPARSRLADALNLCDWRIYHALALKKQNWRRPFSCGGFHWIYAVAQGGGAALEGGDAALALLFFVALLALVDEGFAAGQHEVHHPRELVGRGGVGSRLVHARA